MKRFIIIIVVVVVVVVVIITRTDTDPAIWITRNSSGIRYKAVKIRI